MSSPQTARIEEPHLLVQEGLLEELHGRTIPVQLSFKAQMVLLNSHLNGF